MEKGIHSSKLLTNKILSNEKFCSCRPGWGGDSMVPFYILNNIPPPENLFYMLTNNAGIFFKNDNFKDLDDEDKKSLQKYCELYNRCYSFSSFMVCFNKCSFLKELYFYIIKNFPNIKLLNSDVFNNIDHNYNWLLALENKKICIISPFVETIKLQYNKRQVLFNGTKLLPEMDLCFIKTPLTLAGNKCGNTWYDNYISLCDQIDNLDFDIALLSCGGYGHPLCSHIYEKKNRSCIYVGGILQLYFGIIGKRWETKDFTKKYKNEHWVYPNENEKPENFKKIENGCYW